MKNHTIPRYKRLIFSFAIIGLLLGFACNRKHEAAPSPRQAANGDSDSVSSVIDGDTFVMASGKRVRLLAIDTPEVGEICHDEARALLANLILGKKVTLHMGRETSDHYGRTLAEVFVDTLNIGRVILKSGLAQLYLFQDNTGMKDKYLPALTYAIDHNLGIWSHSPPQLEKYYVSVKGSYRFHRPFCLNLKNSNPNNLIRIKTRKEALLLGLSPCRNCHP